MSCTLFLHVFIKTVVLGDCLLVFIIYHFCMTLLDTYAKQLADHFVQLYSKMYLLRVICELISCHFLMFLGLFFRNIFIREAFFCAMLLQFSEHNP